MNKHGLAPEEVKSKHVTEINKLDTFKPLGIKHEVAKAFLDTPEGSLFFQRLADADPHASIEQLRARAIEQLTSGRELPRIETINEPLVKIVPRGTSVSPYSPFFTKQSEFSDALARGHRLNDRFGLPINALYSA